MHFREEVTLQVPALLDQHLLFFKNADTTNTWIFDMQQ